MNKPEIYWKGASGRKYGYWIHPIDVQFRKIADNVISAKLTDNQEWVPMYIGQTRNFDEGFAVRDMVDCAKKSGATHVHTHFSSPDEPIRTREANDLIAQWKPPCNR